MTGHSPVIGSVLDLIGSIRADLPPGSVADAVGRVEAKLTDPLRVAVAGGVSSGKSTLVNALLGQRVAAVDAGECTRVVSWFRNGLPERAVATLASGESVTVPLTDGRLPRTMPVAADDVVQLDIWLANAWLEELSVVDTPGLNTVSADREERSRALLGTTGKDQATVAGADALIFLMPHLRESDAETLAAFRRLSATVGLSTMTTIGVLSKVDRLAPHGDPMNVAEPILQRLRVDLRGLVADVVPVIGLLAETANASLFTESDARALGLLAKIDDPLDREDMLLSVEDLLGWPDIDLDRGERQALVDKLDLYGIRIGLAAIDEGKRGAAALCRVFDEASGFGALRRLIADRFARQAELLKVRAALADLRRLSYVRDDDAANHLRRLRDPLDRLEHGPDLQRLRLFDVLQLVGAGELVLPDEMVHELTALAAADDPGAYLADVDDPAAAALDGARRWAVWGTDPRRSPREARAAQVVKNSYELAWSASKR